MKDLIDWMKVNKGFIKLMISGAVLGGAVCSMVDGAFEMGKTAVAEGLIRSINDGELNFIKPKNDGSGLWESAFDDLNEIFEKK